MSSPKAQSDFKNAVPKLPPKAQSDVKNVKDNLIVQG